MNWPKADTSEILYMDDIDDHVSQPLKPKPLDATPILKPRIDFVTEEAKENHSGLAPESEVEDLEVETGLPIGFSSRIGEDGDGHAEIQEYPRALVPVFPQVPLQPIPDFNIYQHKKTLAQGMMDLSLLAANANQLRYVLQTDGGHPYFYPALAMIGASLLLQIVVGIGLIWNSRYDVKMDDQMFKAERANNWTVIGIFLVTILNVFISSFGVVDYVTPTPTT
ncbi:hypothetical protein KM043_018169 [Ampulex compressa]|nr:hypothetical protein KM043_018169 [Ampulex compressa]